MMNETMKKLHMKAGPQWDWFCVTRSFFSFSRISKLYLQPFLEWGLTFQEHGHDQRRIQKKHTKL